MNTEKKQPVREYKRTISGMVDGRDKDLQLILSVYDEPIVKTQSVQLFSKFVIMDGIFEWGHGLFSAAIPEDKVESTMDAIIAELNKYKNQ